MSLKIIFMGTPEFAVPILDSIKNSKHKILTVYTNPPKKSNRGQKINLSPIHIYANEAKIKVRNPKILNTDEVRYIESLKADLAVVVAYGKILPTEILKLDNLLFLNIHASLLPRWRGAAPIQRAIMNMDKETGISIMKITHKLDAGPVMLKEKMIIEKNDNFSSLSKKLSILASKLILSSLNIVEKKTVNFIDQDETMVTYAKKINKEELKINWKDSARALVAKINGLSTSPGVWFKHNNVRIKIIKALENEKSGSNGEILDENLTVACGKNSIKILTVQKEGKNIMDTKEFLKGYKILKGEKLI